MNDRNSYLLEKPQSHEALLVPPESIILVGYCRSVKNFGCIPEIKLVRLEIRSPLPLILLIKHRRIVYT